MSTSAQRRLFGTDGIRGIAGEAPLDAATVFAAGLAIGHSVPKNGQRKVIIGLDTRESSGWIARTLAAGICKAGVAVESAGVVPTPAIAFLARSHGFDAGVVISASHNPWRDNGIKLFGSDGFKLPDDVELAIEEEILHHAATATAPDPAKVPVVADDSSLRDDYIQFLIDAVPALRLEDLRIVVDCANGAAAAVAPMLFQRLGGDVSLLNIEPNGRNINEGCGALHPTWVGEEVKKRSATIGVTFDGDADRCMLADANGNVVNGDAILLMAARDLQSRGLLTGNVVVATTMSNMGLEAALGPDDARQQADADIAGVRRALDQRAYRLFGDSGCRGLRRRHRRGRGEAHEAKAEAPSSHHRPPGELTAPITKLRPARMVPPWPRGPVER